jgi:hypothetical protein
MSNSPISYNAGGQSEGLMSSNNKFNETGYVKKNVNSENIKKYNKMLHLTLIRPKHEPCTYISTYAVKFLKFDHYHTEKLFLVDLLPEVLTMSEEKKKISCMSMT